MGLFDLCWNKKPEPMRSCGAVVLAAGSAQRMGFDKMTVMLDGIPVLIRAISAFERSPLINEVVVVTREDRLAEIADLCQQYQLKKVTAVVSGGKTRTESALAGRRTSLCVAGADCARRRAGQHPVRCGAGHQEHRHPARNR